jgi:signal transduction histidine kinase
MRPGDLNALVLNAVGPVRELTVETHVAIHLDLAPDLPQIPLDAVQMRQVFLNIFHNALHAMPTGGDLRIKTAVEDPCIMIEITDTGTGIAPEHLGRIFHPFFTTKTYGTGLGLAISQRIVDDHRGKITVQSRLDEGTTVVVCLPICKNSLYDSS